MYRTRLDPPPVAILSPAQANRVRTYVCSIRFAINRAPFCKSKAEEVLYGGSVGRSVSRSVVRVDTLAFSQDGPLLCTYMYLRMGEVTLAVAYREKGGAGQKRKEKKERSNRLII